MMFNRIIEYVLDKQFNIKQRVFADHLGFSKKTIHNYSKNGLKKGRMLNQLILRLKKINHSTKSNIARHASIQFIKIFECFYDDNRNANNFLMSGFVEGYCFGLIEECQKMGTEPDEFLRALPPIFYSMHFLDAVNLPYRGGEFDVTSDNFEALGFPYNKLSKSDVVRFFSIQALEERPHAKDAGPEVHRLLRESFAGVIASIALDSERLASPSLKGDSIFLKGAWDEGNIVAQYFF